jgi:hypothetical protein
MSNPIQELYAFQDAFIGLKWDEDDHDEKFINNLEYNLNKLPNKQIVDLIYPLINNKLIFVGYPIKNKNFLLGQIIVNKSVTHICGVIINSITHDITSAGESSNFSKITNSLYYVLIDNYLGLFVYKGKKTINDNSVLYDKVYKYFEHILVKNLKIFELSPEKSKTFSFLCRYFFNIYYLKQSPSSAYAYSLEFNNMESSTISKKDIENYTQITDLYNVITYFNILSTPPNVIKYNITNGIGTFAYLSIHNTLQSLIASIIISKYSHPNFKKLDIYSDKASEIETIVYNEYLTKMKIDSQSIHHKFEQIKQDHNLPGKI